MIHNDKLVIGGHEFNSRFILGSGKYSMKLIEAAVKDAGAEIITLAVRRANTKEHENILDYIPEGITLLPNTSGARNAEEAVRIARLARELGCGNFVKVEIMRDTKYLLPEAQLAGIRDGASLVHMMNGNIFTAAAIGLGDGVDAQTLASAWRDTIRQNRWICGQPDKLVMYRIGDQILMAFGSADAMQVWEAKTAEAFPDAHELYNEAVIS